MPVVVPHLYSDSLGPLATPIKDKSKQSKVCDTKDNYPLCIWDKKVPDTNLEKFKKIIEERHNKKFDSYWELHRWSVQHFPDYWEEIWNHLEVIASKPYDEVFKKTGDGFLECEWFSGARFNFAENLLRIRDDRVAIICADETGGEERITFAQMFEEVKLYAAAFRKNGLVKGDRVACYMSNRKEAIYAFLAAASVGAIFGGPQPYFGRGPASKIISKMEPKFLISIDHHPDAAIVYSNIDNLPEIVDKTPSLERVIIIPSYPDTKTRDLSYIKNSVLLEDFLDSGRTPDGNVPDMEFEQLPFDHPISMNFTSGTTGLPKGPVHSAGTLISHLASIVLYFDLKCGDVVYSCYPVGWTLWDAFVPCLAQGVTLLLYAGNPTYKRLGNNLWDTLAQFKVTYAFLATAIVDVLEKNGHVPGPNSNLENLRYLTMGGSPVKAQNSLYVHNKVKKDMFICSQYGSTEAFGTFSGFDLNMPCYATEIQAPALGMDLHCFDQEGNSVLNKRGEMVICKPTPALPTGIWKDEGNKILKETYLSKYPGTWCQSDEIWINPLTGGIGVIGRSDDTIIQGGDRFGAADVYTAIHDVEEIKDSICVAQTREDGDCRAILFVLMKDGHSFTPHFKEKLEKKIGKELWFDCIPKLILQVKGIPVTHEDNGGRCGLCGDRFDLPVPRPHESGGNFTSGVIGRTYQPGRVLDVTVELVANHKGFFEFSLCERDDPSAPETEECFGRRVLELADGTGTRFHLPRDDNGFYVVPVKIPRDVSCAHCVLRWHWRSANNWGDCDNETKAVGCGPQELYRNCADISVLPGAGIRGSAAFNPRPRAPKGHFEHRPL